MWHADQGETDAILTINQRGTLMGYNSTLYGEFGIEPPLRWSEYRDSPFYGHERAQENGKGVCLAEDVKNVDTDDGPMERRSATRVVFAWDYPTRLYEIVDELQSLVDAHPEHEFVGEFRGQGEDFGDIWLLRVNANRKVERILPTITWPDGRVLTNTRYA